MAEWYRPQLAVLVDAPPAGHAWLHEIKFDGYRAGCAVHDGQATLTSRNGLDLTRRFPAIAEAAARLPVGTAHLDGELVALLPDGRSSFHALQHGGKASSAGTTTLAYMAFDLLQLDGEDVSRRPLVERKAMLEALLARQAGGSTIRYASHIVGQGPEFLVHARQLGLEGVVSKRHDAPARAGRSDDWRKTKCTRAQELIVGGFTHRAGSTSALGALLLGYYDGEALVYAGRVGTGWTAREADAIHAQLDRLARKTSPFSCRSLRYWVSCA